MDRITKTSKFTAQPADPVKDLALINALSLKELTPEEVYCFAMEMSNNDVDRDLEAFTEKALRDFAPMFVGKPIQKDHLWGADSTTARIYDAGVFPGNGKTALGENRVVLRAKAYMLKTDDNKPVIDAIEGGIIRDISVGCRAKKCNCSICGKPQRYDWHVSKFMCEDGHVRGETYDKKLCVGRLEEAVDAFESSFVAVPSNKTAGVTKAAENTAELLDALDKATDLSEHKTAFAALIDKFKAACVQDEERQVRSDLIAYAENTKKSTIF